MTRSFLSMVLFLTVILLLGIPFTLAVSITPAMAAATLQTGTPQVFQFTAQSEGAPIEVNLDGELVSYVTDKKVVLDGSTAHIEVTLLLKDGLSPGTHSLVVYAGEGDTAKSQAMVSAKSRIGAPIYVTVPADHKYLVYKKMEWQLRANYGVTGRYKVSVQNIGHESIGAVSGYLLVSSSADSSFTKQIPLSTVNNLGFEQSADLLATWAPDPTIPFGEYRVQAKLDGDGQKVDGEALAFTIGDKVLNITALSPFEFQTETISAAKITVQSYWSTPIDYVVSGSITKQDGSVVSTLSSSPGSIKLFTSTDSVIYLDTHKVPVGDYNFNVVLTYDGLNTSRTFPIKILAEKPASALDPSKLPVQTEEVSSSSSTMWYYIVGIVVVMLILFFIYKRRKDETEEV